MADARVQTLDRAQAEQARLRALQAAAPPAYEDRFMNPQEAGAGTATQATDSAEADPGLRSWLVESRVGFDDARSTGYGRQRATEFGQHIEYRRETLNHGEWALQADLRHLSGDASLGGGAIGSLGYAREATSGRFTLRNLGFPVTSRLFADSAVGDTYSELTDGLGRSDRISLGSTIVRGASTRLFNEDLDLRAGFGQRGNLTGGPYPGFEKSQGTLGWLGLTRRLDNRWFAAAQVNQAHDIPILYADPVTGQGLGSQNVTSWAAALGYGRELLRDGDLRARATLIGSRGTSALAGAAAPDSHGLFVEAGARTGAYRHEFGAYAARPNLYFGDYPLATGTRGVYWRVDRSANRLSWGASFDHERAAPSTGLALPGYRRTGGSANVQYLLDRHTSFGASVGVFQTHYEASPFPFTPVNALVPTGAASGGLRSLYASAYYQTRFFDWPRSRFSLSVRRNEAIALGAGRASGQELQWEQDWISGRYETLRPELTTTLGYARDESSGAPRYYPTAAVRFRYWIDSGVSLVGQLRYTSQHGDLYTSRGLAGTLSAEKELLPGWRAGLALSLNQARATTLPAALDTPALFRTRDKTLYVFLRWEGGAGKPYEPAGIRGREAGTGSVSGQVFLDTNRDGEPQSGEGGAAGVEVVLDGRYRALTDSAGHFQFPMVATGRHQLTLTPETVPLPWGPAQEAGVGIDVPLRGQADVAIPVTQVGP